MKIKAYKENEKTLVFYRGTRTRSILECANDEK